MAVGISPRHVLIIAGSSSVASDGGIAHPVVYLGCRVERLPIYGNARRAVIAPAYCDPVTRARETGMPAQGIRLCDRRRRIGGLHAANRLSEDGDARVLLLEAGGWDRDPWIHIPLAWWRMLQQRRHDWMYFAEPEVTMDGRRIECARGKVIGGSSSINAMAY